MLKIKDLAVGSTADVTLLIKSSEIKLTKAQKPYLYMELTDGTDSIKAQDWDYGNNPAPEKGLVYDFTGQVSEYMGNKQLKIAAMLPSSVGVEAFAPNGGFDIVEYINKAKELMEEIQHVHIKDIVQRIFRDNSALWKQIPAANGIHHAFVAGTLKHSVDVALKAKAIAQLVPKCNMDLVVGGALIHDFGKLWTYQLNGALIEMSEEGQLLEHIAIGIAKLEGYRDEMNSNAITLLQHIVSSHHGRLEYGSPTTPKMLEAIVVNYADGIDAKTQALLELSDKAGAEAKQTERNFVFDNKPMFTPVYVWEMLQ